MRFPSPYYIRGRYHILLKTNGKVHGVHYKGYERKGMADRVAKTLVENGYCEDYEIFDTEGSKDDE